MKRLILLLLLSTLCLFTVNAQLQQSIGAAGVTETFSDVKQDPNDGGTIYVGSVGNALQTDCYLVKRNAAGQVLWERTIPNAGTDMLNRVRVCANGDYITCGRYTQNFGTSGAQARGLVMRVNATTGNITWATSTAPLNSPNGDAFYDLIELINGNIAVVGSVNSAPPVVNSMVALFNPAGGEIIKRFSIISDSDEIQTIAQLPNGTLVAFGHNWEFIHSYDAFVFEMDPNTLDVSGRFGYRVNLNVPGVNSSINTLWPSKSYIVGNNVMVDMVGNTGRGVGNKVQFVYTYTPVTGNLTGNYYYHNNSAGTSTMFSLAANDYIITQSDTVHAPYVSRITNGVIVYDRQVGGNRVSSIGGIDILNNSLMLGGVTPGNDAHMLLSNPTFPLSGGTCPITDANMLVGTPNAPGPVNITFMLYQNNTLCAPVNLNAVSLNNPLGICCENVVAEISGQNLLCIGQTTQLTGNPAGGVWASSNSNIATVNASGVVTGVAIGTAVISYTVQGNCGPVTGTFTLTVSGPPSISVTYTSNYHQPGTYPYEYPGVNNVCIGSVQMYVTVPPSSTVVWTLISPTQQGTGIWSQNGNNLNFTMWSYNDFIFEVTVSNNCGPSITKRYLFRPDPCTILPNPDDCLKYSMYPNPSKGKVTAGETNKPAPGPCPLSRIQFGKDGASIAQMNVYSFKGILLKRVRFDNVKQASADVSDLMSGHYYIEIISKNGYKEKQLLIVQK